MPPSIPFIQSHGTSHTSTHPSTSPGPAPPPTPPRSSPFVDGSRGRIRVVPIWGSLEEEEDISGQLPPHRPEEVYTTHERRCPPCEQARLYNNTYPILPDSYYGRPSLPLNRRRSRWAGFMYETSTAPDFTKLEEDIGPDYSTIWQPTPHRDLRPHLKWHERRERWILRDPLIPLILRSTVWVFSCAALICAAIILAKQPDVDASPFMAVVVDAVALIYTILITVDEYRSKPLGLRSVRAKMRLIFLDMFFIVFNSANLSLSFTSLDPLVPLTKGLSALLLMVLLANMATFTISVLRVIDRAVLRGNG